MRNFLVTLRLQIILKGGELISTETTYPIKSEGYVNRSIIECRAIKGIEKLKIRVPIIDTFISIANIIELPNEDFESFNKGCEEQIVCLK